MFRKQLIEDAVGLCPSTLIKQGLFAGTVAGGIEYSINLQLNEVRLRYRLGDGQQQFYDLTLDTTWPNYGGLRWWAICPCCEQRRRTLYLPATRSIFGCRGCFGLSYKTQRLTPVRRAALACKRLSARYPIPRPKGQWRRTHLRGLAKRLDAEEALWHATGVDSAEASSRSGLLSELAKNGWPRPTTRSGFGFRFGRNKGAVQKSVDR